MESEDRKPIFTRRLILTILIVILLVLIILLLLRRCGNDDGGYGDNAVYISVSPTTVNLEPNESYPVYAELHNSDNIIYWSVQDEDCVTLSETSGNSTRITAGNKECSTIVSAYNGETNTQIPVTVKKSLDALEGLQLNKQNYIVYIGKSALASVTAVPTTAPLPELVYEIDDTSIATVNENGVIKGVKEGTTRLTVRTIDGIYTATSTVTVKKKASSSDQHESTPTYVAASGLEFKSTNAKEVCVGQQIILGYTIKPDNASNKKVRWNVNNPTDKNGLVNEYSSINANGYLTGIKAGTTKVTIVSEDNPNLTATTTITVLSSSSSKCKSNNGSSSGGSSSGGSSSSTTGTSQTSTGTSGGMSCTVSGEVGNNGWYKTLTITWTNNPDPLSDDSNYNRQYCIDRACTNMQGQSYSYSPSSTTALPSFSYKYTDKNNNVIEVTTAKSGGCNVTQKGLDRENPTCVIKAEKINGKVNVYVSAHDGMSGVKSINLNGSSVYKIDKNFQSDHNSTAVIHEGNDSKTYVAQVEDAAGRVGTCSAKIDPNSAELAEATSYITELYLNTSQTTVSKEGNLLFRAYAKYSNGKTKFLNLDDFTVSGGSISGSGPDYTFKPDGSANKGTIKASIWGIDSNTNKEKLFEKQISFTISEGSYKPEVTMNINGTTGDNGWYKTKVTVSLQVSELATDDKVTNLKICAGSGCTPNSSSVTISETSDIYYTLITSKGYSAISEKLGTVKVDIIKPTCSVKSTGDNTYYVSYSDQGSGLDRYVFNGNSTKIYLSSGSSIKSSESTGTVTVYDKAGNFGTCNFSGDKLKLAYLHLSSSNLSLNYGDTRSISVTYVGENGSAISDNSVKGYTIEKYYDGNSSCFTATDKNGNISITATNKNDKACSGRVKIISTYDKSVSATITVDVSKYDSPKLTLSPNTIELTDSIKSIRTEGTILNPPGMNYTYSIIGGNSNCFTISKGGNGYNVFATVTLKENASSCSGSFQIKAESWSNDENGNPIFVTSNSINVSYTKNTAVSEKPSISCGTMKENSYGGYFATISITNLVPGSYISFFSSNLDCGTNTVANSTSFARGCSATSSGSYHVNVRVTLPNDDVPIDSESCDWTIGSKDSGYSCGAVVGQNNTWTNQNVTIKQYCDGSACARAYYQHTFTTTTPEGKGTIEIYDKDNHSQKCSVNAYVDKTLPTCSYETTIDENKWYKGVDLKIKCVDNNSGCHKDAGTRTITLTKSGTYNYGVMDNANNVAMCGPITVKIDKTPPTFNCSTEDSSSGVKVTCTSNDNDSGIDYSKTFSQATLINGGDLKACDKAGNCVIKKLNVSKTSAKTCPDDSVSYTTDTCYKKAATNPTSCNNGTYSSATKKCVVVSNYLREQGDNSCGNSNETFDRINTCGYDSTYGTVMCQIVCKRNINPVCGSGYYVDGSNMCHSIVSKTTSTMYTGKIE